MWATRHAFFNEGIYWKNLLYGTNSGFALDPANGKHALWNPTWDYSDRLVLENAATDAAHFAYPELQ